MSKTTTERLADFINHKGLNNNKLTINAGLSVGQIGKAIANNSGINSTSVEKILRAYPELNAEWLLTGVGKMIKDSEEDIENAETNSEIPLISSDAMLVYTENETHMINGESFKKYKIPELEGKGVEYLLKVSGSSMYPKYNSGDILACKPLKDLSFFQWGKTYVLDTDQGPIVKRLFPSIDDKNALECRSDNKEEYPPFIISKSSIKAVAIVVGVICLE